MSAEESLGEGGEAAGAAGGGAGAARGDRRPGPGDRGAAGARGARARDRGRAPRAHGARRRRMPRTPDELRGARRGLPRRAGADAGARHARGADAARALGGASACGPCSASRRARRSAAELERLLPAAAAVELVHSFSLVHDDLPALDNDEERRGQPSVWAAYGEATAILAGDALVARGVPARARLRRPRWRAS